MYMPLESNVSENDCCDAARLAAFVFLLLLLPKKKHSAMQTEHACGHTTHANALDNTPDNE